jgi:plastocyanin
MRTLVALAAIGIVGATGAVMAGPAAGEREAHAAKTVQVNVRDDFFSRTSLTVDRGTRVRWVWRGRNPHDVTVTTGPTRFASSTKRSGDFARTLRKTGAYRIICTVHEMRMRLVVRRPG